MLRVAGLMTFLLVACDGGETDSPVDSSPSALGCHADLGRRTCAFLGVIAYAEGTGDRYDIIFSYETFTDYSDHPRRRICAGDYCSDAAGRYQFLSSTWDEVAAALDLPDFTPASQDEGALYKIDQRGAPDPETVMTMAELGAALEELNREWASLPGSPYGQPTKTLDELWEEYERLLSL